jgi:integrase
MTPRTPFKRLLEPSEEKAPILEPHQFKALLLLAGEGLHGRRNRAIIWHSFGSALRVTEIAHLKVRDVLDCNGEIKAMGTLPASYTKNNKPRTFVQLGPGLREALDAYLAYRVQNGLQAGGNPNEYRGLTPSSALYLARGDDGFSMVRKLYIGVDGTQTEYIICSSLQNLISSLIKRVGVTGGSSHSGRRTFATRMRERGIEDELIQALLGRGHPNQTMAYIGANLDRIRAAQATIYADL